MQIPFIAISLHSYSIYSFFFSFAFFLVLKIELQSVSPHTHFPTYLDALLLKVLSHKSWHHSIQKKTLTAFVVMRINYGILKMH